MNQNHEFNAVAAYATDTPARLPEDGGRAVASACASVILPPDPLANARRFALVAGNNLHCVENYAREYERGRQRGAREKTGARLEEVARLAKRHEKDTRAAMRRVRGAEPTITAPGDEARLTNWEKAGVSLMWLALVGAVYAEIYNAALLLTKFGAFGIESVSEGMLVLTTAFAVGLALKFAYNGFSYRVRKWTFGIACSLIPVLFAVWSWNLAVGARAAAGDYADTQATLSGENVGDIAPESVEHGDAAGAAARPSNDSWFVVFFSLTSLSVLTTFAGQVGIEKFAARHDKKTPNPLHAAAKDDVNFHTNECTRLKDEEGALKQRIAQLTDSENAAAATARAAYLDERARLSGADQPAPVSA